LKPHKEDYDRFMATITKAKSLTEQKRYYVSDYGIANFKDIVLGKTDKIVKNENFDKHHLANITEWWKKKASSRFESLKEEDRLRTEMEVWTNGKVLDIIR
jgi:hypothetical protein